MTARYYGLGTLLRCLQAAVGNYGLVSPSLLLTGRGGHSRATWSAAAATAEPGCVEDGGPERRPCRVARHCFTFKSSSGRQPESAAPRWPGGRDSGSLRCERQSICAEAAGSH